MLAKPVVDRLAKEIVDTRLVRISASSRSSIEIAQKYGVRGLPTLLVFDGMGTPIVRQVGRIDRMAVLEALASLQTSDSEVK